MGTDTIYFITKNSSKKAEIEEYFNRCPLKAGLRVAYYETGELEEIQSLKLDAIVRDKALKAYAKVMRPVFVDHSGLMLTNLGDFPGGVTEPIWESLKKERFAELFLGQKAEAFCVIAYCDGKKIYPFQSRMEGTVCKPCGSDDFAWDCVFLPEGQGLTLAELKKKDKSFSVRTEALESFRNWIEKNLK